MLLQFCRAFRKASVAFKVSFSLFQSIHAHIYVCTEEYVPGLFQNFKFNTKLSSINKYLTCDNKSINKTLSLTISPPEWCLLTFKFIFISIQMCVLKFPYELDADLNLMNSLFKHIIQRLCLQWVVFGTSKRDKC